jgi:hypothetical protein
MVRAIQTKIENLFQSGAGTEPDIIYNGLNYECPKNWETGSPIGFMPLV